RGLRENVRSAPIFSPWLLPLIVSRMPGLAGLKRSVLWKIFKRVEARDPSHKQAALSPKTGEKTVANQDDVGRPFGMLRENSLLGVDAVDQRRPTHQYQEERDRIPFL